MAKYRKKPVVIEAIQFRDDAETIEKLSKFIGKTVKVSYKHPVPYMEIETLEGVMRALPNDYIIRGVRGEFYSCRSDIFEETYEKVDGE